ncbi:hypothetical protein niasHT_039502 [Heterodera trifolii]|uniref:Glutaredoxin domain-containing protein n=1 Tax=Heterodera trifolii TaxID=157864 RepID=A0ABD2J1Q8_9BILA
MVTNTINKECVGQRRAMLVIGKCRQQMGPKLGGGEEKRRRTVTEGWTTITTTTCSNSCWSSRCLLALLTTQQQTTAATPINRMPTQPMPMITPETMEMPMMATTTMEMPIMTTPTTATTHGEMPEEKTPPIQKSTTSLQALSQQIRRLPAVLYADSRKSDSRQLEVLLRDGYGLPLVTFYADKIGRLAAVEANLAKLTAHREMPFLFICGTFIGSLEHIKKYHEQKQMPRLVEFVCSGEAEKSGDGAETAPVAGKALEKQNKGEEMGRKRRRESNSRKRRKKKKKRKEEEEKEEKEENWK